MKTNVDYLKDKVILNDCTGKEAGYTNSKGQYETVDNLIAGITIMNSYAVDFQSKTDKTIDGIAFKVTEDLNEKLKDIPENKSTWDEIYASIPPFMLSHTARLNNHLIVFGNYRISFEKIQESLQNQFGQNIVTEYNW